jgi:hypothetical protein
MSSPITVIQNTKFANSPVSQKKKFGTEISFCLDGSGELLNVFS